MPESHIILNDITLSYFYNFSLEGGINVDNIGRDLYSKEFSIAFLLEKEGKVCNKKTLKHA